MTADLISRSQAGDDQAFAELVDPYRRELLVHCYRMLGSLHDAEDALQETLLAAWRGPGGFEQRASIRTWLYQVATRCCLMAVTSALKRARAAVDRAAPRRHPPSPPRPAGSQAERDFSTPNQIADAVYSGCGCHLSTAA